MNLAQTLGAVVVLAAGPVALAGIPIELQPGQTAGGLVGTTNTEWSELIGSEQHDFFQEFTVTGGSGDLYSATLMTRVVRSNQTDHLHFNYRIMDPNEQLSGQVSYIEITGFQGLSTRVEYRNETTAPGDSGPFDASRDASGDMLTFNFGSDLATGESSRFFFAMVDADDFTALPVGDDIPGNGATATIYLNSGESVTLNVVGPVPAPGALGLLAMGGLVSVRRRR